MGDFWNSGVVNLGYCKFMVVNLVQKILALRIKFDLKVLRWIDDSLVATKEVYLLLSKYQMRIKMEWEWFRSRLRWTYLVLWVYWIILRIWFSMYRCSRNGSKWTSRSLEQLEADAYLETSDTVPDNSKHNVFSERTYDPNRALYFKK